MKKPKIKNLIERPKKSVFAVPTIYKTKIKNAEIEID